MKRPIQYCLMGLILLFGQSTVAYAPGDCAKCHKKGSSESRLQIPLETYNLSVHAGKITCQDCHNGVLDDAHKTAKGSGSVDCGQCHEQENRHGTGAGSGSPPGCYSCHTRHGILPKDHTRSSVHPQNLKQTCGACHPAAAGDAGFLPWLPSVQIRTHGKQDLSCAYDEGDCLGCHQGRGAHGEERPISERDCYKCHLPSTGHLPLWGRVHPVPEAKQRVWSRFAGAVYTGAALVLFLGGLTFCVRRFSHRSGKRRE